MYFIQTVDCEWNIWPENWTECTESCGGGTQTKSRNKIVEARHNGKECEGNAEIVQTCNLPLCEDGKGLNYTTKCFTIYKI